MGLLLWRRTNRELVGDPKGRQMMVSMVALGWKKSAGEGARFCSPFERTSQSRLQRKTQ